MSAARLERLVNLTMALMAARRPLSVAEIATSVYGEDVTDEAFRRKFERDKNALREQGIPVVTEPLTVWDDTDVGYRIERSEYALPDLHLDADEAAALGLAARVWNGATLGRGAAAALRKLEAAGVAPADPGIAIAIVVDEGDPALAPSHDAVTARRRITFDYQGARDDSPRTRTIEPWGVTSWHGRWYVVGRDTERDAERAFRLSRITGDVTTASRPDAYVLPAEPVDLLSRVAAAFPETATREAVVRVELDTSWTLRRQATAVTPADDGTGADLLIIPVGDLDRIAELLAGLAPQAVVISPPDLRDAVVRRLTAVAHP